MLRAALSLILLLAPALGSRADEGTVAPRQVRVLVQNVYGRREKNCEDRYRELAGRILSAAPAYDVIVLQEHWRVPHDRWFTCDADVLTRAIESDGRYAGTGRSERQKPGARSKLELAGGNSVFTLHRISETGSAAFSNARRIPLSGWLRTRVDLGGGAAFEVWNVHLEAGSDGCDDACRAVQAGELAAAMKAAPATVPVLIAGDFNTGGPLARGDQAPYPGNGGYDAMLASLGSPVDLWLAHGTGDGATYDCAANSITNCSYRERIDYALLPDAPSSALMLVPKTVEVVRWTTPAGGDVSDHYGLDATLELSPRPAVPAAPAALSYMESELSRGFDGAILSAR